MHGIVVWIQTVLIPTLGPFGLFVVAFFDSSFLSVPEINDVLVVTSSAGHPATAWMYVLAATLGSLAGCSALWYIGRRGGEALTVVEQIREAGGVHQSPGCGVSPQSWSDVSSWYWAALLGRTRGPWWAISLGVRTP